MNLQDFIERAHAVALEVERDITKAERLDGTNNSLGHFFVERAWEFDRVDFDSSEFAMMSQAQLPETQASQDLFALFDLTKPLGRHFRAVGQAR